MPRGLTLLELLVAISLVAALAALSAPVLDRALSDRAFASAGQMVEQHLLLARAHAQALRQPVEVVFDAGARRLRCRWFEAGRRLLDDEAGPTAEPPEFASGGSSPGDEVPESIPEPWAIQFLPGSATITDRSPAAEEGDPLESSLMPLPEDAPDAAPAPLRLAVFLPDGSILLGAPSWLRDGDGRAATLAINPFTGVPRVDDGAAPPARDDAAPTEAPPTSAPAEDFP